MALQPIQFAAHSYIDRSLPISAQRLINGYLEAKPQGSKAPTAIHGTPGLKLWALLVPGPVNAGPVRGMHAMGDYLYVVAGNSLYRLDDLGTSTPIGVISGIRPVHMADNGTQLVIVSDFDIYYATITTFGTLSVNNCIGVTVHDGYAIFAQRGTQRFFISDPLDVTVFNALEYADANAIPDINAGIVNLNRETWVFQERSIQIYYNSGAVDFPFTRIPSGIIERGCIATNSIAAFHGSVFWLGDDKRVYMSQGYNPIGISTSAIDRQINLYDLYDIQNASGFVYEQEGHIFYVLNFDDGTFVYDVSTQLWHERLSVGFSRWRPDTYCYQFGKRLVGDSRLGRIYELDLDTYTDDSNRMILTATAPPLNAGGYRAFMSQFFLDMETGVGLTTGQGSNPQVILDWSDDGGSTYSSELSRAMGAIGERKLRVNWRRLGQFRQRTMRVRISDPVKRCIIQAYADVDIGDI